MIFRIRLVFFSLLLVTVCKGQGYLMREIELQPEGARPLRRVLESIGETQGFYFSYSTSVVAADSLVTVVGYRGTLGNYLSRTLGSNYELKESPGHVIIRYAPRRMAVTFDVEKRPFGPLVVEGQLKDAITDAGVPFASVYERQSLASALSDQHGKFRVVIKRPGETVWLTVSKTHYRDTTVALISPVRVNATDDKVREWFYPDGRLVEGLESSAFGRFFSGSRQRIQALNLGGFFAYSPFQVSLTPGLSTGGMLGGQLVNRVSLNVVGGRTAGVDGVEMAGGFNVNQSDVRYVQVAGLLNVVGRDMSGFQAAGIGNKVLGEARGIQAAGLFNAADRVVGLQVSGLYNVAQKVDGVQLASLINLADSSDYPIGLINLVKTGQRSLSAGFDDTGLAQLSFRSGGRVLYGLVAVGYRPQRDSVPYAAEAGLGARLYRHRAFAVDAELVSRIQVDFHGRVAERQTLRVLPVVWLSGYLALTAGPMLSYAKNWQTGWYGALVLPLL